MISGLIRTVSVHKIKTRTSLKQQQQQQQQQQQFVKASSSIYATVDNFIILKLLKKIKTLLGPILEPFYYFQKNSRNFNTNWIWSSHLPSKRSSSEKTYLKIGTPRTFLQQLHFHFKFHTWCCCLPCKSSYRSLSMYLIRWSEIVWIKYISQQGWIFSVKQQNSHFL